MKYLILTFLLSGSIIFISCKDNTENPVSPSSSHINFVGQRNTPGNSEGIYVSDVSNINYAFVADGSSGLQIINISSPSNPIIVGSYNTIGEAVDVFVSRINGVPYAFISDGFGGYTVINVSSVANPVLNATISFSGDYVNTSFIDSVRRIAYVGTERGNLALFDLSNLPNAILFLGSDTTAAGINCIQASGNLAYLAIGELGLEIENVSIPEFPSFVSSFNTPGNSQYIQLAGHYAYIADGDAGITILDVIDSFNPSFYKSIITRSNALGIFYYSYAAQIYIAEGSGGCELFSVAGFPPNPQQLGYYNNNSQSNAVFFNYPYIFIADGQNGLLILQYTP